MPVPQGFRLVRSLGPFPAVANAVLELNLGAADVVQIVEGAQEGLILSWQDPRAGRDFNLAGAVELDRPDVAIAVRADVGWLRWPASVLDQDVTLRVWSAPASLYPRAWERSGRAEVLFLKQVNNLSVAKGSTGVLVTEAEVEAVQRYHAAGDIWLRRWSGILLHINVSFGAGGASSDVQVALRIRHTSGGTTWVGANTFGNRTNWEQGATSIQVCRTIDWPIPATPWRIQMPNLPGTNALTVNADIVLTTDRRWSGGQRQ